jgi:DNA polymerase-3 subunit delta'
MLHPRENAKLFGHSETYQHLLQQLDKGRMHHALLLNGPKGIGKATLAYHLAADILARGDDRQFIAGKVAKGSHPDLYMLSPDKEETERKEAIISVQQVRKLRELSRLTPVESAHKVIIIDAIDDMNTQAANALLKILEEPPQGTYFILLCHAIEKILATIRSRSQVVKLKALDTDEFCGALAASTAVDDIPKGEELERLHTVSRGNVGLAIKILTDENLLQQLAHIEPALKTKKYEHIKPILEAIDADASNFPIIRDYLLSLLRKRIKEMALKQDDNLELLSDFYDKVLHLFTEGTTYNADKKHLIISILG